MRGEKIRPGRALIDTRRALRRSWSYQSMTREERRGWEREAQGLRGLLSGDYVTRTRQIVLLYRSYVAACAEHRARSMWSRTPSRTTHNSAMRRILARILAPSPLPTVQDAQARALALARSIVTG